MGHTGRLHHYIPFHSFEAASVVLPNKVLMSNELHCGVLLRSGTVLSVLVETRDGRIGIFVLYVEDGHIVAQTGQAAT